MANTALLQSLPEGVWRGNSLANSEVSGLCTGHAELNASLPGGGWPVGALSELLYSAPGCGEMELLLPVLRRTPAQRWIALVSPPWLPYAPALAAAGLPMQQLLLVRPEAHAGSIWACRQLLAADCCHAVLLWAENLTLPVLRRLQLAAEMTHSAFFLLRPHRLASQPSPARLRLQLEAYPRKMRIRILKRRGAVSTNPIEIPREVLHSHAVDCDELSATAPGVIHPRFG